jgi:uncharacterized protein
MSLDITPMVPPGRQVIQNYGSGQFMISGVRLTGPTLVFPERSLAWNVAAFEDLSDDGFAEVIGAGPRPEILLVGAGSRGTLLPPDLRAELRAAGIIAECMNTGAACRTFNVLVGEDRRVAAALFAVD